MTYHTLALTAVLGYVVKVKRKMGRYRIRVKMELTKSVGSEKSEIKVRYYFITLDLLSPKPENWKIELIENDSVQSQDRNRPELKECILYDDGSAKLRVEHPDKKEYEIVIKSDNQRDLRVEYKSAFGSGSATGTYTSDFLRVPRMVDEGFNDHYQRVTLEADIRIEGITAL